MLQKMLFAVLLLFYSCSFTQVQAEPNSLTKGASDNESNNSSTPVKLLGKRPAGSALSTKPSTPDAKSSGILTSKPPAKEAKNALIEIRRFYTEATASSIRVVTEVENVSPQRAYVEDFILWHLVASDMPLDTPKVYDMGNGPTPFVTKHVDDKKRQWEFLLNNERIGARAAWFVEPKKIKKITAEIPLSQRPETFRVELIDAGSGIRTLTAECEYTPAGAQAQKVISKKPSGTEAIESHRLGKRIFRNLFIDPEDHPEPPLHLAENDIYYVACEYEGNFDVETAKSSFVYAAKTAMEKKLSVAKADFYGSYTDHEIGLLRPNTRAVFGWYNQSRNQFGFIAVAQPGKTPNLKDRVDILDEKGKASQINDWKWFTWETNGHVIRIKVADNDRGGAYAKFSYDDRLFDNREDPSKP